MILDSKQEFFDATNVYANSSAAVYSTDSTPSLYVDFGPLYKSMVSGIGMKLYIKMTTAATGAGGCLMNFVLQTDDNAAFSSPTTIAQTGATAVATFALGYEVLLPDIPSHKMERYCRLGVLTTVANGATGACDACLLIDKQTN